MVSGIIIIIIIIIIIVVVVIIIAIIFFIDFFKFLNNIYFTQSVKIHTFYTHYYY